MDRPPLPSEKRALSAIRNSRPSPHALHADLTTKLADLQRELEQCRRCAAQNDRGLSLHVSEAAMPFVLLASPDPRAAILGVCVFLLGKLVSITQALDQGIINLNTELRLDSDIHEIREGLEKLIAEYPQLSAA